MDSFVFLRVGNRVYPGINKRHLLLLSVYAIPVRFILLVIQVVTWVWPDDIRSIVRFFLCLFHGTPPFLFTGLFQCKLFCLRACTGYATRGKWFPSRCRGYPTGIFSPYR